MVNLKCLAQLETLIRCTDPGENRDRLEAEFKELSAQRAREEAELFECESVGFRRNQRAGKCSRTGITVGEFAGFYRKEAGRFVVYSWAAALEVARGKA